MRAHLKFLIAARTARKKRSLLIESALAAVFCARKLHLLLHARALVAFPGGCGSLDELFEVLALVQTRKIKPLPIVLVGENYWHRTFVSESLVGEGVI